MARFPKPPLDHFMKNEDTHATLEAIHAMRACAEDTHGKIDHAHGTQIILEQVLLGLQESIAAEAEHSPGRRVLAQAAGHLLRAIGGLEGYCTILKLLLPTRTDASEQLDAALDAEAEAAKDTATELA